MPVIGGIELAKEIHHIDNTIPIVMMTGSPSYENVINTLKNGVVDFLAKPIEMSLIPLTIQRVIRERSLFIEQILLKEASQKNQELKKINTELKQKLKEVQTMNSILRRLDQTTTSKDLFKTLVNLAGEITRCDEVHFYIFTSNTHIPVTIASFYRSKQKTVVEAVDFPSSIKKVIDEGIPLINNDVDEIGATMAIPLKIRSNTFGALGLIIHDNTRYFLEKDL
jgi:response regulator RpfG family c-di-GMP phosphodiesterase